MWHRMTTISHQAAIGRDSKLPPPSLEPREPRKPRRPRNPCELRQPHAPQAPRVPNAPANGSEHRLRPGPAVLGGLPDPGPHHPSPTEAPEAPEADRSTPASTTARYCSLGPP